MQKRRSIHSILFAVAAVLLLRLLAAPLGMLLSSRSLFSLLILTQTGRLVYPAEADPAPTKSIHQIEITQRSPVYKDSGDAVVSFSPEDLESVEVSNLSGYQPDLGALLTAPLGTTLHGDGPTVLIIHSHTSESYTGNFDYIEPYRTVDENANMVAIGAEVARVLELAGIQVIHDKTIYDQPDYNSAYDASRAATKEYLAQYPTIRLVLDIHRDAAPGDAGQLSTHATVGGQDSAQLMLVVGTSGSGLYHPDWEKNLSLALKLNMVLERTDPGITRPITLRKQRFNGDLSTGSLLIEVGAAGNKLEEAIIAANALARGIIALVG